MRGTPPLLRSFLQATTVTAPATQVTYNGSNSHSGLGYTASNTTRGSLLGSLNATTSSKNVGTYSGGGLTLQGLHSGQQGYDISYAPGSLNITLATLTINNLTTISKVYDGSTNAGLSGSINISALGSDMVVLGGSGSGSFSDKNVGTGKAVTVTVSGYPLTGTDAANYQLTPTILTADITPKALPVTLSAQAATKIYGDALTGSLTRAAGQTVGRYPMTQGSLANSNYVISFIGNSLQITPKVLAVTAQAASKTYGDADNLQYSTNGLINSDILSGSLTRAAGENVGSYDITQGNLTNRNYDIRSVGNTLHITPKTLTVTASNAQKQQGQTLNLNGTEFVAHGLVGSETVNRVQLQSTGAPAEAWVGHHAIVASQA